MTNQDYFPPRFLVLFHSVLFRCHGFSRTSSCYVLFFDTCCTQLMILLGHMQHEDACEFSSSLVDHSFVSRLDMEAVFHHPVQWSPYIPGVCFPSSSRIPSRTDRIQRRSPPSRASRHTVCAAENMPLHLCTGTHCLATPHIHRYSLRRSK